MKSCPTTAELENFLDGCLSVAKQAQIQKHVENCKLCQQQLERLTSKPGWKQLIPSSYVTPESPKLSPSSTNRINMPVSNHATGEIPDLPGYTITEKIGQGGMGVVYRAQQRTLNRLVAIKLLNSENSTPEHWVRFGIEAEAIARLQHPNIVRVFDSGQFNQSPYVIQELAENGSLAERTSGSPVAPNKAALWVKDLAGAVEHAHQQGVLHRDIKPSNILFVGETIKLADFGLAKLSDRDDLTLTQDVIGTPAYMAPEQAVADRESIGPSTDVFALGILLYELVTGINPFRAETAIETIRLINDHEPVSPRILQPAVPRDLSTICLKCLEKEPPGRYVSAAELQSDLARFLDGKPIHAKPSGLATRTWKWSRRRPALATLLAVVFASTAALLIMWARFTSEVSSLNRDLSKANESLKSEKLEAERQKNAADAVRTFVSVDLLQQTKAHNRIQRLKKLGIDEQYERDPRVSTIIQRAARSLDGDNLEARFPDQPEAQMETLGIIGDVLDSLGRHDEAAKLFERALKLRPESDDLTDRQWKLWNYVALQYSKQQKYEQAIERFQWLLEKGHPTGNLQSQATVEHNLAGTYYVHDKMELAIEHGTHAVEVATQAYGPEHPQTLVFQATLGGILAFDGRNEEASELLEQVLAGQVKLLGEKHPRTISTRSKLAKCLHNLKRLEDSLKQQQMAAELASEVLGPNHRNTLHYQREVARCLRDLGRNKEALATITPILEFQSKNLRDDHQETKWSRELLESIGK